ncbi:MAG: phosphohistidine phosphatase, partial [Pedobacter sp.]
MAKQLILVRHGKAENQLPDSSDFDRKLTNRGRRDATEMAERLKARSIKPSYLFSSPAPRALETGEIFSRVWDLDPQTIT